MCIVIFPKCLRADVLETCIAMKNVRTQQTYKYKQKYVQK